MSMDKDAGPKDPCRMVYAIFFWLGIGTLLPWNMFITVRSETGFLWVGGGGGYVFDLTKIRGVCYPKKFYFPPPLFQNDHFSNFPRSTIKMSSFPRFNPYIYVFLKKSSYFSPNKPIN